MIQVIHSLIHTATLSYQSCTSVTPTKDRATTDRTSDYYPIKWRKQKKVGSTV